MKLKDLALLFTAGLVTIAFVIINLLSYIFIEKGVLLISVVGVVCVYLLKFLIGLFV